MKKSKIILACFLSGAIAVTSCKKSFTNIPYYGLQTVENTGTFTTLSGCQSYVTGVYSAINVNDWWQTMWTREIFETATDNGWLGNLSGFSNAASYRSVGSLEAVNSTASDVVGLYQFYYVGIQQCNFGIANISTSTIDAATKTQLLGELHFLRGFFYMDLAKNYGGVPLYNEKTTTADIPLARATLDQTWAFINADFEFAAANLPQRKDYTTAADKARASKGAALAYLAYANLWSGHYDSTVIAASQLIGLNEYTLEPNYGDIFKTAYYNGQESIFEIGANNLIGNVNPVTAGSGTDGGWGWHTPSSNLEDAFLTEGDSIRRVNTIMKNGQAVAGDPAEPSWNGNPSGNTSGRNWRKYYIPQGERNPANQGYTSRWQPKAYIFMRLANVMLIYAEAAARNGDATTATNLLNQVRARVSLAPKTGLSGDALISAIINEKRLELAGEYADVRWDDLHRVKINGTTMMSTLFGPNGTYVAWLQTNTDIYDGRTNLAEVTQNKGKLYIPGTNDLFPIPLTEIEAGNGKILQNPGY